jgi:malonyl-CoA O-methyltransferase
MMDNNTGNRTPALILRDVQQRFDFASAGFDNADFIHRHSFEALLQRLTPITLEPRHILDLGCATGSAGKPLARRFRGAKVIGMDSSLAMLERYAKKKPLFASQRLLQADALRLPLQEGSVDLVFANMLLPWIDDLPHCLREVARVTRKNGLFAFATLGPDSLAEIRRAWAGVDTQWHVNAYPDMHDLGDALVSAGLRDPVLDVDYLTVTYRDTAALYRDLTSAGGRNCLSGRKKTLTGKERFRAMDEALADNMNDGVLSLKLELVYGHAWGSGPRQAQGEFHVDPTLITRRRHA